MFYAAMSALTNLVGALSLQEPLILIFGVFSYINICFLCLSKKNQQKFIKLRVYLVYMWFLINALSRITFFLFYLSDTGSSKLFPFLKRDLSSFVLVMVVFWLDFGQGITFCQLVYIKNLKRKNKCLLREYERALANYSPKYQAPFLELPINKHQSRHLKQH